MDMPCKGAVPKIGGVLEKNSVIDVREVGSDVQCPAGSFVRVKFFSVVFWAVTLRSCR